MEFGFVDPKIVALFQRERQWQREREREAVDLCVTEMDSDEV